MKYLITFIACFMVVCSAGATIIQTNNDIASLSNAYFNVAMEGDSIFISNTTPTTLNFSNTFNMTRAVSVTIYGDTNNVIWRSPASGRCISLTSASHNLFTIHDLDVIGGSSDAFGAIGIGGNPPSASFPAPFHIYNLVMTNTTQRAFYFSGGFTNGGLVDHCVITNNSVQPFEFTGNEYEDWSNSYPNPIGTTNAIYVEDCYISSIASNGHFDGHNGGSMVWRHNIDIGSSPNGLHGYDSQPTSCRTWEIYDNTFIGTSANIAIELRGGTGVVFSNTVTGYADVCELAYYRSSPSNHLGTCQSFGQPGQPFSVNFANTPAGGWQRSFNGQPSNGSTLTLGVNGGPTYTFVTSYADGGQTIYGGGNVVIGANVAETITNLYNCMTLGPGAGTKYAASATLGYWFQPVSYTSTDIYLTNMTDGTNAFGYPANQQPGVLYSYKVNSAPFTNNQVLWMAWAWGNTLNGSSHDFTLKDNDSFSSFYIANLVKAGRDYSNGIPTLAQYTPLIYPHPLNSLDSQPTITNFSQVYSLPYK